MSLFKETKSGLEQPQIMKLIAKEWKRSAVGL